MALKEYKRIEFVSGCIKSISKADNPEFRTCEILTRIDNMMTAEELKPVGCMEKIRMLKSIRKGLEAELKEQYRISRKQHDPVGNVLLLIDRRIDEYTLIQGNRVPVPGKFDAGRRIK